MGFYAVKKRRPVQSVKLTEFPGEKLEVGMSFLVTNSNALTSNVISWNGGLSIAPTLRPGVFDIHGKSEPDVHFTQHSVPTSDTGDVLLIVKLLKLFKFTVINNNSSTYSEDDVLTNNLKKMIDNVNNAHREGSLDTIVDQQLGPYEDAIGKERNYTVFVAAVIVPNTPHPLFICEAVEGFFNLDCPENMQRYIKTVDPGTHEI